MKMFLRKWKNRYFEGIAWMKVDEGLPQLMYVAAVIAQIMLMFRLFPEDGISYTKVLSFNFVMIYLYSIIGNKFIENSTVKIVKTIGFVVLELLVGIAMGRNLNPWMMVVAFIMPIVVAIIMVFVCEKFVSFEDFIHLKEINRFGVVLLGTMIPVVFLVLHLVLLDWNILIKTAIVIGFIAVAPMIAWADSENYGIFGAIGLEW